MMRILVDKVTFAYPSGVRALDDVSLEIEAGESVALIGQNGAGKTTLARHLNGLLRPSAGRVMVGDWWTGEHTVAQLARRVGYVFQHPEQQIFKRTVRDEVAFGPRNLGFSPQQVAAATDAALDRTLLAAFAASNPHDLLPSRRKLVALASVLAMDTPVVVLDEPTSGQDGGGIRLIGQLVEQLLAAGKTVVTITHDMDFAADHCRRFVVLHAGRVVLNGPAETVFAQPETLSRSSVELPQLARLARQLGLGVVWESEPLLDALAAHK